ncbi:MAG: Eco57I restriction-modification methylase domain-containing protein [Neisseria sp.]|nr:Eco57I restriction-modification methylase domain-containing protein [Neisseria sp.]
MNKSKDLGQVITPVWLVNEILDAANYRGQAILRAYALEPSCGDGAFLLEMVRRYIAAARAEQQTPVQTAKELAQYLFGIELDDVAFDACIANLNRLVAEELGDVRVNWQVFHANTLDVYSKYPHYFQWIVGNPPYIRVHHLDADTRARLKREFRFTVGTSDLYLAFFEMALAMLAADGILAFITPNSFLHNTSYRAFRAFLQQDNKLLALYDSKSHKVFDGFSTYTAISVLKHRNSTPDFAYYEWTNGAFKPVNRIAFADLRAEKWSLASRENSDFLAQLQENSSATFGDLFEVQYGFATLRDKIFINPAREIDTNFAEFNGYTIEKTLLKPIVKGSRFQGSPDEIASVLFPYHQQNGRWIAYSESELQQRFPFAYAYLLAHKTELQQRDSDKNSQWFEFGRSQGLQTAHQDKIVISNLVGDNVRFHRVHANVLVYSGMFITLKNANTQTADGNWQLAERILASPEFWQYARLVGKDLSGGYKSISSKQIKAFPLPVE